MSIHKRLPKGRPFFQYLLFFSILIITVLVIGITIGDYLISAEQYHRNIDLIMKETEQDIIESIQTIDTGLKLFDDTMNSQMERSFFIFHEEYRIAGGDPSKMNLSALKNHLGGEMDLYIINESGVVEYTTYTPDLGLDFRAVIPYFYEYLTQIRNSEGFFPDRTVQELTTGKLKKFAYFPTYDHRYILELGLSGDSFKKERNTLSYTKTLEKIKERSPFISSIRIFTTAKREVGNKSFIPDESYEALLDSILEERKTLEIVEQDSGIIKKYLFINLQDSDYAADMSLIVEVIYNQSIFTKALNEMMLFHLGIAILAFVLASLLALFFARELTRPIELISEDVDRIAGGDLDHKISPSKSREFNTLEESINTMVASLKGTIRELQVSESLLRHSEKLYRGVVESQTEFITRFRPDGVINFANDAYCRYFGLDCEDIIGKKFIPEIPHVDREMVDQYFRNLTIDSPTSTIEHRIIMPDGGTRWQQWNDTAIFDEEGKIIEYQSVGRDITARISAEEEIRQLAERLEERVKERTMQLEAANRELESFSYSVSHDLRSPLRAIDGFSSILLEEYKARLPSGAVHYLEKIGENARQMSRLIEDLLDFSRTSRQSLTKVEVDTTQLVLSAYQSLRPEYDKRAIDLNIGYLPECLADPVLLRLVFTNLLSNALKFTRDKEFAEIQVGSTYGPSGVVYFVRDNGIGFDMKYANKLFSVFQRLHDEESIEGTGVGLAIVQRIIHRHGGDIWVHSEKGIGTTFFFTLEGNNDVNS
jgi:PAS domain S-box-containing protein